MNSISVSHLVKTFKTAKKEPGLAGSLKSFFKREYTTKAAVCDVSFEIEEGELVGFIGPNGAGKTTTLKSLSGLLYPTSGEVSVLGYNPYERKNGFLKQIALVMGQKNQLWWDLPAEEGFLLNKEIYEINDTLYKKTLNELIELLDAREFLNIPIRNLSLGQRMKCELIAALLHNPKILFLDEPTIGLDVVMQKNLREFIKDYNKKWNATILLTSHYMQDVRQLCKRIIMIDHGKIMYDGPFDDIVKKYARNKLISVTFNTPVSKEQLTKLGKIKSYEEIKVLLEVPVEKSNSIAAQLLKEFDIEDINIEEPEIEDIIRDLFAGH